ncbi:MAG: Uma2 family endonuclease [Microcoleus sp. PH2017_40_RAT_O_B]|uniref:Uma2 family endonuclease n=1 Tax=unclassified Microcoleus TaxID=2642155 RepID=UPI001D479A70|nr:MULTISPECIES: Uma2 family endonuclease [unclassified Microcoleus]MCC3572994.1 Uma2 family endonuclease [Microcoleus sp. PH2017_34_RAT_O_A]MCC3611749.1 Uma2 family endonuclease [Microcoleus sp. PH2017_40_RAT_O_B]
MTASTEIREEVIESKPQPYYTPAEYFALEEAAEDKSEYCRGQILPMPANSANHNMIVGDIITPLNFAFKGQKHYHLFALGLRLWIPQKQFCTYHDVMVVAGKLEFAEGRKDAITNVVMVAEVLSKSTANYDRGDKFKLLRSIPTLREYILIDQYEMHVEQFSKTDDNKWVLSEYDGAEAVLVLSSVQFEMSLGEMYDRVDFESEYDE